MGVFGAAFNATISHVKNEIGGANALLNVGLGALESKFHGTHLLEPATFHDYRRGAGAEEGGLAAGVGAAAAEGEDNRTNNQDTGTQETPLIPLMDSGLDMNFPLIPLLRPERGIDLHIVLDYSQYDPEFSRSVEWEKTEHFCRANGVPFPRSFDHKKLSESFFSVFPGDAGGAPTIIVIHLKPPPRPPAPPEEDDAAAEAVGRPFDPLLIASEGGFTDLATPKYTGEEWDQLFNFSHDQVRSCMSDIKAALVAEMAGKLL